MACNIHMAHSRHCPFCAHGWQGQSLVMIAIIVPQVLVSLRTPWTWMVRMVAGFALFPVVEGISALVLGFFDGYWAH